MILNSTDWIFIIAYLILSLTIGILFTKKAGQSLSDYFLSNRQLPWYIAGISMVATTFAADTPLVVTELVNEYGIAGNWFWWNMLMGGMLTTFFFARYWRRAEILTEVELTELRYGGKPAAFLRGFRAVYLGLFMNILIMAWVNMAFMTIIEVFFEVPRSQQLYYTFFAMSFVAIYSGLSGLWGIVANDFVQFIIAMTGSIVLAIVVVQSDAIGGIAGMKAQLPEGTLNFLPAIGGNGGVGDYASGLVLGIGTFLAFIGIQWWSSWYPGNEPGGGGYVAQRMMSTKNEKNAFFATLFFQIAHYCIRPWPWIIVGLSVIILYPELPADEKRLGYVMAIRDYLPAGWRGLLFVALMAAYMSTISTQLNWGSSYLINDVYLRFLSKNKDNDRKKSILFSRIMTVLLMVCAILMTTVFDTIKDIWFFIVETGAGLGLVLILRWYWWRISAWSEISATFAAILFFAIARFVLELEFPHSFYFTVSLTTISWILVTYLTPPESKSTLEKFYTRIRPGGAWKPYSQITGVNPDQPSLILLGIAWVLSIITAYSVLFATGKLILQETTEGMIFLVISIIGITSLVFMINKYKLLK